MPKVTISIVTYNGVGKIEPCLQSLHAQTFTDYEVIVVDNASTDGTVATVTNTAPEAKIIQLHENVGFGAGHNIAINASTSPYVLVLNQDVTLEPNALQRLVQAADQSRAAVTGPLLLRPKPLPQDPIVDTAGLKKRLWWAVQDRGSSKPLSLPLKRSGFVWGISGACALLSREALQRVSYAQPTGKNEYFDESFFMYKEDVDLCARFRKRGLKAWYEADAVGYHGRTGFAPSSATEQVVHRRTLPTYVREFSYRNHWLVVFKHAWLWQMPIVLFYELVKLLFIILLEPKTLRVTPEIFKRIPLMLKRRYA